MTSRRASGASAPTSPLQPPSETSTSAQLLYDDTSTSPLDETGITKDPKIDFRHRLQQPPERGARAAYRHRLQQLLTFRRHHRMPCRQAQRHQHHRLLPPLFLQPRRGLHKHPTRGRLRRYRTRRHRCRLIQEPQRLPHGNCSPRHRLKQLLGHLMSPLMQRFQGSQQSYR